MSEEFDEIEINEEDYQPEEGAGSDDMEEEDQDQTNDFSFFSFLMGDSALCVAINPMNKVQVCVGCLDNNAKLFVVDSAGAPQASVDLVGHSDSVVSAKFTPDGSLIATGSYDSTIRLWSAVDGSLVSVIEETGSEIEVMAFHPSQNVLVAGCADGSVWVWSIENSEPVMRHMLRGHAHGSGVRSLDFLGKDFQGLLSTSEEGICIVWNLKTGQIVHKTRPLSEPITSSTVHPSKPIYAVGTEGGFAFVMHAESGKVLHKLSAKGSIESIVFSPCGTLLAMGTLEGILEVWHIDQLGGYPRHRIDLAARLGTPDVELGFTKLVWHPDASLRCIISVGKSGRIDLWNGMTGEHITNLEGHQADVLDVSVALIQDPQGRQVARVVSVCDEGYVKMFSVSQDTEP
jgi:WD40 repeat protein